eukprot:gene13733-16231_t
MSARLKSPASKNTLSVTHESPDNGEVPEGALVINEDTERTEDLGRHNRESEGVSEEYVRGDEVRDIPTVASVAKHETQSAKPKSGRSDLDKEAEEAEEAEEAGEDGEEATASEEEDHHDQKEGEVEIAAFEGEREEPAGEIPHASSDKDATHPRLELPRANYPPAPYHVPNQKLINATYMALNLVKGDWLEVIARVVFVLRHGA